MSYIYKCEQCDLAINTIVDWDSYYETNSKYWHNECYKNYMESLGESVCEWCYRIIKPDDIFITNYHMDCYKIMVGKDIKYCKKCSDIIVDTPVSFEILEDIGYAKTIIFHEECSDKIFESICYKCNKYISNNCKYCKKWLGCCYNCNDYGTYCNWCN
jgi:hypothetical protein